MLSFLEAQNPSCSVSPPHPTKEAEGQKHRTQPAQHQHHILLKRLKDIKGTFPQPPWVLKDHCAEGNLHVLKY